ncbi:YihY/virulence factor BrkB family protein [Prevotella brevis]|uniref:YihY/virulence factor BrkB family protein n=1 Tax=Xylanibacter brevis TaxID=83231 RepID=A0ABS9CEV3_9BACT|nr:YihY/virulence factor BrkB family protein [Xylanibacter brevis]MCF2563621.1 YihY/virulence factor BrkB family protein [Xylanibacter brevis]
MKEQIRHIIGFFRYGLWQLNEDDTTPFKWIMIEILKKLVLAIRFFTAKRVVNKAAALTYSSLLAIVPILAVVFAIARGFGYNKYIEVWFRDALQSQPQAAEVIIGFVNSYLVHTKSGIFLGIGLLFMLYTVLMLVSNVEQAFNEIWQVKKPRTIFRTFTDYLAMFFCFPILIVLTSGLSIFMATMVNEMDDFMLLTPVVRFLIDMVPYVLMSGLFIAFYIFMPNTHVKPMCAVVPGILAGIAMQGVQIFYIHAQMFLSSYNAIYGSFAALPLFMLWLQISWTICLFGVELCYTNQNLDYYDYDANTGEISYRYRVMMCALLMSCVAQRFKQGGQPLTALDLRKRTRLPIRIVNDLLYKLIDAKLLLEVSADEKGETSSFIPAHDLRSMTVGTMVDHLESVGTWKIELDVSALFTEQWCKTLEIHTEYLHQLRNIPLEDLAKVQ